MIEPLTESTFKNRNNRGVNILSFSNEWCPQCYMEKPIITKIADEYGDRINFYEINADENPELAKKYDILTAPSLIIEKDGELVYRLGGFMDKTQLSNLVKYYL
ncbi:thioredoxin family protein [Companilactobacillus ginsenosidimutans]|uniref:Thioredoxin n=1 Tax=Companilactobacillus ginsenosidimutans TaxID=1007676 RepID=A0A0H4QIB5_9LACO|nr:thioredoxin family protein [Companilactobacillus ginsenosidimutans]AKP67687.1 thioredoxin [Companilactobacillus ginsenosidimutans]